MFTWIILVIGLDNWSFSCIELHFLLPWKLPWSSMGQILNSTFLSSPSFLILGIYWMNPWFSIITGLGFISLYYSALCKLCFVTLKKSHWDVEGPKRWWIQCVIFRIPVKKNNWSTCETQGHTFMSHMENNSQDSDSLEDKQLPSMNKLAISLTFIFTHIFFVLVLSIMVSICYIPEP